MLRIIIGRTGSGKSEKCITEFNAYIQENRSVESASYLFVPEQYNMLTERRLLNYQVSENFPVKGLMGHEVLNFKRFVHRILSIYGLSKTKQLTECGKIMLLTAAISNKAKELLLYKSLREKNGEIIKVLSLIDEFGKYGVTYSQLNSINTEDSYLNRKLHDIALIYEEYENLKKGKYSDENDYSLTPEAQSLYLGIDGKQVGIYGGSHNFNTILTHPHITYKDIASKTEDNKLKVNIKVEVIAE